MNWYREIGGVYENAQKFGRKVFIGSNDNLIEAAKRFGEKLIDRYVTMYNYKGETQSEADMYGSFYLDFDADNLARAQEDLSIVVRALKDDFNLLTSQYRIYFSGAKGFHLVISPMLFDIMPKKKLNEDYKKLALYFSQRTVHKTIDTRIYDSVRLFRIPNTINSKTGLYKVRINEEEALTYSLERLEELASEPRIDVSPTYNRSKKAIEKYKEIIELEEEEKLIQRKAAIDRPLNNKQELLPCVLTILSQGAEKGNRNNTAIILASCLLQAKDDIKEVMELMVEWNESINVEPLPESELRTTVLSAYGGYKNGQVFGCKSIREIGFCLTECHLNRRI